MTLQFSKCQDAELARMEFFKAVLQKTQGILDLTKTNRYVRKYVFKCTFSSGCCEPLWTSLIGIGRGGGGGGVTRPPTLPTVYIMNFIAVL